MLYKTLKFIDFLLLIFWSTTLFLLSVLYYVMVGIGFVLSFLWKGLGLLPFIYPLWKKFDKLFSLRDSSAGLSGRKASARAYKNASRLLRESAVTRVLMIIPVIVFVVYMVLYHWPLYLAYHHKYQTGIASWYGPGFYFNRTANGELFIPFWGCTAASTTLPLGTKVLVKNLKNGKKAIIWINDRGPFIGGRVIDLTRGAAERIGMVKSGVARVKVTVVGGSGKLSSNCS